MASLRTKSVSTKVTEEEYARFETVAGDRTISEWAREVLSEAANPNSPEQVTLAEVLALRTILLNLYFALSQGQTLSAQEMQEIIQRADQGKLDKARQRLAEGTKADHEREVVASGRRR